MHTVEPVLDETLALKSLSLEELCAVVQ